uniref:TATA-box-binding protein n=1 Tax=Strigamia maritima TaxID=126957 RepID=T1J380_STRMM
MAYSRTDIIPEEYSLFPEEDENRPRIQNAVSTTSFPEEFPSAAEVGNRPRIQNVVSTCSLGCKFNLDELVHKALNCEYNKKKFPAAIMRIRSPNTTGLVFGSGKFVCTGAKSAELSRIAARKYARILQKMGYEVKFSAFKIRNMVGSASLGLDCNTKLRLETFRILEECQEESERQFQMIAYEPELFPGMCYRLRQSSVVILIFVSGKIVITGAVKSSEVFEAFDIIAPLLKNFLRNERAICSGK